MKITFDDKSYLDIRISNNPGNIYVIVSAKDKDNDLKRITNSVEITIEQFKKIIGELNLE